jgi:hypothetical protein
MKSLIICTVHQILLAQLKQSWWDGARGIHGRNKKCIKYLTEKWCEETWNILDYNIKMYFKEFKVNGCISAVLIKCT